MERWGRAFIKNDKEVKELFGVKKEVFIPIPELSRQSYATVNKHYLEIKNIPSESLNAENR